jgi:hypothetical protein
MSTFALITGTIFRAPVQKISKSGKPYTTCTVKAGSDDGTGDFWSVICFSENGQLELLRLEAGDALSVRGKMKLEIFEARISRTIFADAALGLRPAPRERKPKAAKPAPTSQQSTAAPPFDDGVPFAPEFR